MSLTIEPHQCQGEDCEHRKTARKAQEIEDRIRGFRTTFDETGHEIDAHGVYLEHVTD
ncbi:MAG: hypothetical protein HUU25_00530 [Candidatus Sumerlaeia bacterium]|nr:hypothetical protein [Candidatus Sumerlaeia bacterium]